MLKTKTLLASAAGVAATMALAAPAAAQYQNPYNQGGVVGQIIGNVLGYGQYPYGNYGYGQPTYMNAQLAVNQCARAVEARLNGGYGGYAYRRGARVLGIDSVDVRSWNRLRIKGVATSGRNYRNPWGYGRYTHNRSYGTPDLRFTCRADRSGRVHNVDIDRYRYRTY